MTKELIKLKTREGDISVMAYEVIPFLYVHKVYHGAGEFSDGNYWTITHKNGYCIKNFCHTPMKLKEVVLEVGKIAHLDWNKEADFFSEMTSTEKQKYFDAVHEMHGF